MSFQIQSSKSLSPLQQKLLAKLQAARELQAKPKPTLATLPSLQTGEISVEIPDIPTITGTDRFGHTIQYNQAQQEAINLISSGQSCVVIGAAGTGKTTIQKAATESLLLAGSIQSIGSDHRYLPSNAPGIVICAFTRRATNNIRKNVSEQLQPCCITIHKLLEYEPTEHYVTDDEGNTKRSMRFEPARTVDNPLPSTIHTIIIEEASMVSIELFNQIRSACRHPVQFVFLGDIQQLPPVFGSAILGYKMLELPVVELVEVHRQALDSPILSLAHRILSGSPISTVDELKSLNVPGKLKLHPWQKRISAESATITLSKFFIQALDQGVYNPETDGILIPFNKSCGTDELNRHIATRIAQRESKFVYEIIHGFKKSYYSVGDKCLFEREDAIIISIESNPQYQGVPPKEASPSLDYWGHGDTSSVDSDSDIDAFLANISAPEEGETVRAASHTITLQLLDSERVVTIKSAGEVDSLILGYAITIHKSQGSEWDKVFLLFHHSHSVMTQREILYTGVTRAKKELYCICEPDTFDKGITRQRIKGSTWQEKAEYFKGKLEQGIEQS